MWSKDDIVFEIRRTASENGGVPLGRQRFLAETGIREADWLGKYWVRWSDAVRDAGFSPNALQAAYTDDFLLEKLASLVKHLGHYPVKAEFRIKTREDRAFPNEKTFSRFGPRDSVVSRLLQWSQAREEFADVAAICLATTEPRGRNLEVGRPSGEASEIGFVYLLKSGRYYKIGRSNAVGRRERELAIQLPEKANVVHTIRTDDPAGIEAYWHRRFASTRKNGEWFDLSADDLAAFRRRRCQ